MAEPTDAEIDAALERGREARLSEPRAATARYDRGRNDFDKHANHRIAADLLGSPKQDAAE